MHIIKSNIPDNNIITQITDFSEQYGYEPFWAQNAAHDFNHFYYITEGDILVSFLGIMPLSPNSAEITGMTMPEFRRRGYFGALLKEALTDLAPLGMDIFCETKFSYEFINCKVEHSDLLMILPADAASSDSATSHSANLSILEYAYDYDDFTEYIYVGMQKETPVGLLKIHQFSETACIHHVAIRKPFRLQGCGSALLSRALSIYTKENSHDIMLHVTSNNVAAVRLYTNYGFKTAKSLEYYRINYCPQLF